MKNEEEVMKTIPKLKPVTFAGSPYGYFRKGEFQQNLLLKALQVTTDPQELRRMIGVKSVADVYRTLDKLSIRKEYHQALFEHGLTLEYIVQKIKGIIDDNTTSPSVKLKGLQALLKSVGLDRYEKMEDTGKSWEELLLQTQDTKQLTSGEHYKVNVPPIPDSEKENREKAKKLADELYGK